MKRSHSFDVDGPDFEVLGDVTKATTLPDGRRLIRGVASGVLEDRDGERVSARAIAHMAAQPVKGLKVVAGTHDQNWTNEIGDVVELRHDPETDELIADAILPPEGEDPLADKAWKRVQSGKPLGYSIGGKLTAAYRELAEDGNGGIRKRKVLDGVLLRHLCLTEKPAYRTSVVEAIAKTASDFDVDDQVELYDEPAGTELADAEAIAKAAKPKTGAPDPDEPASEAPQAAEGNEADAGASPPAGTADTAAAPPTAGAGADPAAAGADVPSDAQEAQGLPMAQRHLACPNCGEEFAAPLPDGQPTSEDTDPEPKNGGDVAAKTTKEIPMDVKAELAKIRALVDDVEKRATEPAAEEPTTPAAEVAKTDGPSDVEKMLAALHARNEERFGEVEKHATEGFELVAGAVQKLSEQIQSLPQGRRSVARVIAPTGEVEKTATETDDVQKRADELAETGDLAGALKVLNERTYGIR